MKKILFAFATLLTAVALMPDSAPAADTRYGYRGKYYAPAYRAPYRHRWVRHHHPRALAWRAGVRPARYYARGYAAPTYAYAPPAYTYAAAPAYAYAAAPAYAAPVTYGYQTVTVETHAVQRYTQPFVSAPVYTAPVYAAPAYHATGYRAPWFRSLGCGCFGGCGC